MATDDSIEINKWNDLLMHTLQLNKSEYDKYFLEGYTYGLSDGKYIYRDRAVAGMVKLLHVSELIKGRDATEKELIAAAKSFRDFQGAFDQSKLAIAYSEGLVKGYENGYFYPGKLLTKGEAIVLVDRIVEYWINRDLGR